MDWFAGLAELCGVWMVGNRNRWGFAVCMICNVAWIVVASQTGVYGLIPVSLAMLVINGRNFHKWRRYGPT